LVIGEKTMRFLASVVVLVSFGVYGADGGNGGIHHRDSGENGVISFYSTHFAASVADRTPLPLRPPVAPRRIISLIPAVTEMLFAIGAGPQVVAVSSFDRYPPQVEKLQRVGALIDPDVERILSLRPDMVAIYASQGDLRAQLERAKIPVFVYSHAALVDITATMKALGERVGHEREAADLARTIETRIDAVRKRVAGRPRPSTLIVFDRESLALRGIYASGGFGFIHDMVDAAGGENVFADVKQQAVQATTELILSRRPHVILELRGDTVTADMRRREIAVWQALSSVPAVRDGRVYFIDQQLTVIPGPRVADAIDLIARTLHSEAYR
jgi:iron complex transport system substrate-binding protein